MKRIFIVAIFIALSSNAFAYRSNSEYNSRYNNGFSGSDDSYAMPGTHYVSPYTRDDGTYVEGHLSGNSGSGIHCHDNVCE